MGRNECPTMPKVLRPADDCRVSDHHVHHVRVSVMAPRPVPGQKKREATADGVV